MKDREEETNVGLNQIFEIINAKGDTGEIQNILMDSEQEDERKEGN